MKIVLLADYYQAYLAAFHARGLPAGSTFAEHERALFEDYFGAFISYRNWFRAIGHECELIVPNCYALQQKWLDERGLRLRAGSAAKHEVVLRQLAELRPDVLFVSSMFDYYGAFFLKASRLVGRIVTWIACPHPSTLDFSNVSCVISSVPAFVEQFRRKGLRSERLAAAFDEELARRVAGVDDDVEVSFIGGLHGGSHGFRVASLRRLLAEGLPVKVWGYGLSPVQRLLRTPLARAYQGEAWGLEMYRTLARSRITLNFHIDVAKRASFVGNMRMYEATGCGALLLTDSAPGVETLFRPGTEIETFGSQGELEEKLRHHLAHPAEAEALARRGQAACLARHGYGTRIREFERILLDVP